MIIQALQSREQFCCPIEARPLFEFRNVVANMLPEDGLDRDGSGQGETEGFYALINFSFLISVVSANKISLFERSRHFPQLLGNISLPVCNKYSRPASEPRIKFIDHAFEQNESRLILDKHKYIPQS